MGACRNFCRGQAHKRPPPWIKKAAKGPHMVEKSPDNEKNVAKRPPYEEKVAKRLPIEKKKIVLIFRGGGGVRRPTLAPPPAGAHVSAMSVDNGYVVVCVVI